MDMGKSKQYKPQQNTNHIHNSWDVLYTQKIVATVHLSVNVAGILTYQTHYPVMKPIIKSARDFATLQNISSE